jgi:hypothetical protein
MLERWANSRDGIMKTVTSVCAVALISACAAAPHPEGNLEHLKNQQVRQLALGCYREHEGFRFIHGDPVIWSACRRWAETRIW